MDYEKMAVGIVKTMISAVYQEQEENLFGGLKKGEENWDELETTHPDFMVALIIKVLKQVRDETLEEAAKIAENEPELNGNAPNKVKELSMKVGFEESHRATVRATKKNISMAIRQLKEKP